MARKFNTRQYIDAIIKNGYPKVRTWVQFKKGTNEVGAACANGQALLNLGVKPRRVHDASYIIPTRLRTEIIVKNDETVRRVTNIGKDFLDTDWYLYPQEFEIPEEYFD